CDATCAPPVAHLPSFPTRRSSDLEHRQRQNRALLAIRVGKLLRTVAKAAIGGEKRKCGWVVDRGLNAIGAKMRRQRVALRMQDRDRKSTRLNSSHRTISYAVFCLK